MELAEQVAGEVLGKAAELCGEDDEVTVVHVVDPASIAYSADPTMTGKLFQNAYETTMANARRMLEHIVESHKLPNVTCHVGYGRVAHEVHEMLKEGSYDCLMIGSHGWSGWQRLLGSKAASLVHGVPVDTWIFRVSEKPESE